MSLVIGIMKSSENVNGTVISAIVKLPNTNCMAAGSKHDLDTQLKTMSSNILVLTMLKHEEKVNERKQEEKLSSYFDDVGYCELEIVVKRPNFCETRMLHGGHDPEGPQANPFIIFLPEKCIIYLNK